MELYFLLLLFVIMIAALGSGFPVAFALPGAAIISISLAAATGWLFFADTTIFFAQDGPIQWLTAGVTNFRGVYWEVERDTLIAIPLFIFMGIMLQRSRIAEDLLVTMAQLFGPVPGGLGISVVIVGALLAATTGIVGATVVAMGLISLPAMMRNKYSPSLASGTICASGTLGQIIPPSIVLIILADQLSSASDQASSARKALYKESTGELSMPSALDVTSTSAGDMFLGAFLPGLVLVGLYLLYILVTALIRPASAPAVPNDQGFNRGFLVKVASSLIPPLVLIFVVLGSIVMGVATVNQAGAIGAVGAMIMAGYRLTEGQKGSYNPAILAIASVLAIALLVNLFDLNIRNLASTGNHIPVALALMACVTFLAAVAWSAWRTFKIENTLPEVMMETAKTTSMVFIILLGAAMLTAAFRGFGGEEFVKHFLTGLPGGFWTQFIVVMLVIFLLGFFLDFIEIAVVVVPIVAPILLADPSANITAVWLGVMIGVNMQTSFLTPPFGFALFYLRGVADKAIKTLSIYRGVVPFIALQLFGLVIVGYLPQLVNYLPNRFYLSSYNAPPPQNPKLQACVEEYLTVQLVADEASVSSAYSTLQTLDLTVLPNDMADKLANAALAQADIYAKLAEISALEDERMALEVDYAPLHGFVRDIQRDIAQKEAAIKELKREIRKIDDADEIAAMQAEQRAVGREIAALESDIPANWDAEAKAYGSVLKKLASAKRIWYRSMSESYDVMADIQSQLADTSVLAEQADTLANLSSLASSGSNDGLSTASQKAEDVMRMIAGGDAIANQMGKARRLAEKDKMGEAAEAYQMAVAMHQAALEWRQNAASLSGPMDGIIASLSNTVGLRSLSRLPAHLVPQIASCRSKHRDISLQF
ncbi:MAG: TRAP transporter large permease subunit [Candidatus Puniceispirillaceae bacterium]